jgi:hypothetical protein
MSHEWISLVRLRLREDLAIPEQLAACKNPRDMYRLYIQYFQNAYSHYQAGLEQMTKCSFSIAEDALDALRPPEKGGGGRRKK